MLSTRSLWLSTLSMADRGKVSNDIPYMWNLKRNDANELTKQKETHRLRQDGAVRKFGMDTYTLLYIFSSQLVLLYQDSQEQTLKFL